MSCNSEPSGMRRSNSDGRGFSISRAGYRIFCRSALLSVSWKGFVRLRCGGLSSCFATSDDLARGARM
jgi:hypothetical protein